MPIPTPGWPAYTGTLAEVWNEIERRRILEWGTYRSPHPIPAAGGLWAIPPWPPADAVKLGTKDRYMEYTEQELAGGRASTLRQHRVRQEGSKKTPTSDCGTPKTAVYQLQAYTPWGSHLTGHQRHHPPQDW